jgi:hypothetical protein
MIPARLTSPTVGFNPTTPHTAHGDTIDPFVSVPIAAAHNPAATATADPELDPDGFRSSAYGFRVNPPRALHPLVDRDPRKFAHSDKFVFAIKTAPASRNFLTTVESARATDPSSAFDPAVVCILSPVSRLSFTTTGNPHNPPRAPPPRPLSTDLAISSASGLTSIIAFNPGPARSIRSIRSKHPFANDTADAPPASTAARNSPTLTISQSHRGAPARTAPSSPRNAGATAATAASARKSRRFICNRPSFP